MKKSAKEIKFDLHRERAHRRQGIAELLSQVRTLQQSVGRAQYENGSIPKELRWELEQALSGVEQQLWSEWKNPRSLQRHQHRRTTNEHDSSIQSRRESRQA